MHPADRLLSLQKFGNPHRILIVLAHAKRQGPKPPGDQKCRHRVHDAAQNFAKIPDFFKTGLIAADKPGGDIMVPAQVFGCAVNDDVDAPINRTLIDRCCKGGIEQNKSTFGMCCLGQ